MKIHGDLMSVEDVALVCVSVALVGVWMLGGVWWPLGMMLALVGWGGAVAVLVIDLEKDKTND